jgi:hypothetical protein
MLVPDLDGLLQKVRGVSPSPIRKIYLAGRYLSPVHYFEGQSKEAVLVVAGIHGSEPSGIEIANWLKVKLERAESRKSKPHYTTLIIPEVFPTQAQMGRQQNTLDVRPGRDDNTGRDVKRDGHTYATNRLFPPPGRPGTYLLRQGSAKKGYYAVDDSDPPERVSLLLPEIIALFLLIDTLKPIRIASLHGKRWKLEVVDLDVFITRQEQDRRTLERAMFGSNFPGVFVDPRYQFSGEAARKDRNLDGQKFSQELDPSYPKVRPPQGRTKTTYSAFLPTDKNPQDGRADDDLCLEIAIKVAEVAKTIAPRKSQVTVDWSRYTPYLVVGNHLELDPPTVHYAYERSGSPDEGSTSSKAFPGYSLGDWGPVSVLKDKNGIPGLEGKRGGAAVYTFETFGYAESGAFRRERDRADFEQLLDETGEPIDPKKPLPQHDATRCLQLQAYAEALRLVFLEEYKPSVRRVLESARQLREIPVVLPHF